MAHLQFQTPHLLHLCVVYAPINYDSVNISSFQILHLLCHRRMRTHCCAVGYYFVNFISFLALHPFAVVAAWVVIGKPVFAFGSPTLFPLLVSLLDYLLHSSIKAFWLGIVKRHLHPCFSPFFSLVCSFAQPFDDKPSLRAIARPSSLSLLKSIFSLFFAFAFPLARQTYNEPSCHTVAHLSDLACVCISFLYVPSTPLQVAIVSLPHEDYSLSPHNSPASSHLKSVFEST